MKAKIFLIVCTFMCVTWIYSTAQDKANNGWQYWTQSTYWTPVWCNGVEVDMLEGGEIRVHIVGRSFNNGKLYKQVAQLKGEITSESGEVFKIREIDKWYATDSHYVTWKYNLKGDMGSHYHGTVTINRVTGEMTIGKTVCH